MLPDEHCGYAARSCENRHGSETASEWRFMNLLQITMHLIVCVEHKIISVGTSRGVRKIYLIHSCPLTAPESSSVGKHRTIHKHTHKRWRNRLPFGQHSPTATTCKHSGRMYGVDSNMNHKLGIGHHILYLRCHPYALHATANHVESRIAEKAGDAASVRVWITHFRWCDDDGEYTWILNCDNSSNLPVFRFCR